MSRCCFAIVPSSFVPRSWCFRFRPQHYGLKTGDKTWILDPRDGDAALFLVHLERPTASQQRAEAAETIQITRQAVTPEQAEASRTLAEFMQGDDAVDGAMFNGWTCGPELLDSPEMASQRRAELQHRWDTRTIALHKQVAAESGHDSVRGLLGMDETARQLAQSIAPPAEVLNDAVDLIRKAHRDSTDGPNATLRLMFADGSQGIWRLDAGSGQWAPDWSLFYEPDGNQIPLTADDMRIGTGYTFTSQDNLEWFLDHSTGLGIPVDRQDGGASAVTCVRDYRRLLCQAKATGG